MKIQKETGRVIFKATWLLMLVFTICDLNIAGGFSFGLFTLNIQASSFAVLIYIAAFLLTYPLKEIKLAKYDKTNILILLILLCAAYLSSYLSVMQKYALVTTTSRYTLFLLALFITICYSKNFDEAGNFILKSFVIINFFVALSCLAEYFITDFYNILVSHFGVMESKHSNIHMNNIVYMRPSGFVTDANLAAFTLGVSSFLLLLNQSKFNRIFTYFYYLITGLCFGMLASRSAFLMVLFLIITAVILKHVQWKQAVVYFLLFFIIQGLTPQTQARFFYFSDEKKHDEEMELGRPLIWKADYLAMRQKPWIGIGSGVFFKQSDIYIAKVENKISEETYNAVLINPELENKQGINPHNIFFTMQIEYGAVGSILFLIFVLYNIIYLIRSKKLMALAAALGILFVSSLSNYAPYYKYYLLIIIIFFFISDFDLKIKEKKKFRNE
jgi:O-antigen ligase/polysaccharide polymerase Wzy-like membrane protein